jgi:hypothetical protein
MSQCLGIHLFIQNNNHIFSPLGLRTTMFPDFSKTISDKQFTYIEIKEISKEQIHTRKKIVDSPELPLQDICLGDNPHQTNLEIFL